MREMVILKPFLYFCSQNRVIFMKNKKPLILISNDDGYQSKGIRCLIDMIRDMGDILVCAPEDARSGYSCAFSATQYLTLKQRSKEDGVEIWSCNGTPVDCVKLALNQFCRDRMPDMVIGGINHGDNASVNTHYSGTMGVTLEGCMKYIPSVAFSLCDHYEDADFEPMRPYVRKMTKRVLEEGLPKGVCLNVNFPLVSEFRGVRVCRMAHGTWGNECVKCHHPRGYDYFWMVGSYTNITPTQIDVTAYEALRSMKNGNWEE